MSKYLGKGANDKFEQDIFKEPKTYIKADHQETINLENIKLTFSEDEFSSGF